MRLAMNGVTADGAIVRNMNLIGQHRGPDGSGISTYRNLEMGHARLAIIDLSDNGHQPMDVMGRYVITFNGEIYNYIEIRKDLEDLGHTFKTSTDTEVIVMAYHYWGDSCVSKFNGMWAFCILDKQSNCVFMSRDRFGVKPMFFAQVKGEFLVASELKMLIPYLSSRAHNPNVMQHFLVSSVSSLDEETFFQEITSAKASHNYSLYLTSGKLSETRYYHIPKSPMSFGSVEEAQELVTQKFSRAVNLRMRSDVEVGSCLSGGLDSSAVVSFATEIAKASGSGQMIAVHGRASEMQNDESGFAKSVAVTSGARYSECMPSAQEFLDVIEDVVYTQDEPFGGTSIFMQYFVMKHAREQGCKVMLDGQGGDETLLGYEKYVPAILLDNLKHHGLFSCMKELRATLGNNTNINMSMLMRMGVGHLYPSIREFVIASGAKKYKHLNGVSRHDFPPSEYTRRVASSHRDLFEMQRLELTSTHLPALLRFEDRNSMRHGVEARLPFLDYEYLGLAINLPVSIKYSNGWSKNILRQIVSPRLGEHIAWRKNKFGFNAPEKTWFDSIKPTVASEIMQSKILRQYCDVEFLIRHIESLDPRTAWKLYNIAVWERLFKVT